MSAYHDNLQSNSGDAVRNLDHENVQADEPVHLISVGTLEHGCILHGLLLDCRRLKLSVVTSSEQLWEIEEDEQIHLVILHDCLSLSELDETARLIRRRWAGARILVLRSGEDFLEDALYDERLLPSIQPSDLLVHIERALDKTPAEDRTLHS